MPKRMTVRPDDDVKGHPEGSTKGTQENESFAAPVAVLTCVENDEWQIGEIRLALKEADEGDFASDHEVAAVARQWK